MLSINEKIEFFKNILLRTNNSYADNIKEEIYEYFFEKMGDEDNIENFTFLSKFNNQIEIAEKVDFIVSKIIMNEHHAGIDDLIHEYTI